jgi:UDP-glucose 4-epimerase
MGRFRDEVKMSTILVIGGAGFIGSHMVLHLLEQQYQVVVLDNLSTGHQRFVKGSLDDPLILQQIFSKYDIDVVMHFAAFIEVGESVNHPRKYYENNVIATLRLLENMLAHDIKHFIFSSSAAIFGEPHYIPIDLNHPKAPLSPYGRSKWMVEQILSDFDTAYGLKYASLRYFNASGADPKGRAGEWHQPETHLIPLVLQVAHKKRAVVQVFGSDYDTPDGTCIRDYIHVCDLCTAHELAMKQLVNTQQSATYNLGNGEGFSVKQVIQIARDVTGRDIPVQKAPRRQGDPARLVADARQAQEALQWHIQYPKLTDIIAHAWQWELACH